MEWTPIAISMGAVLGALSRYYLTLLWVHYRGVGFPYGTMFVNLTGSLLIGFWTTWSFQAGLLSAPGQHLIVVGFLGAYTTFSSYILDTTNLFKVRQKAVALVYWLGSPVLGLLAVKLGSTLADTWS